MQRFVKNKPISLANSILLGGGVVLLFKYFAIARSYGYLFPQMGWRWTSYFFLLLLQGDVFVLALLLGVDYIQQRWHSKITKIWSGTLIFLSFLVLFLDGMAMFAYQQRLSLSQLSSFFANADAVVRGYLTVAIGVIGALTRGVGFWAKKLALRLNPKVYSILIGAAIVFKLLPLPLLQLSSGDLPVESVFSQRLRPSYQLTLSKSYDRSSSISQKPQLSLTPEAKQKLQAEKQTRLRVAQQNPESIFQDFPQDQLVNAIDETGQPYLKQVLFAALQENPELAFTYLDRYKDRKDEYQSSFVKEILAFAIRQNPDLAFRHLQSYQHLVENNEKIAKSLLEYATTLYQDKLTFPDLFAEVEGRNNKKNLILVFYESASAIDSKKFGGIYDRFPLTDKIASEGTVFTNLLANGMTSEMGHISTLLGVEPMYLGTSLQTSYERFTGGVAGLGTFFKNLGYKTHFVSTVTLDFLNQRDFLKKVGFEKLWEDGYANWERYTFNAAPDEALYEQALDVIENQTSPYFLTLQTISSHLPYSTPYGSDAESMYRYMDESFAKFYTKLKASGFFKNGILIVLGDHRKMVPQEKAEFELRGPLAEVKIMGFMIGSGIAKNTLDPTLYQQTDVFYSLLKEFGSGSVKILEQSNDIFAKELKRDWAIRNFLTEEKAYVLDLAGNQGKIDLKKGEMINDAPSFNTEAVLNYLILARNYQKLQNNEITDEKLQKPETIQLIAHRGATHKAPENTLAAFKDAHKLGADGLEFDVTMTKDNQLIVFHGPKTYNTTCTQRVKDICEMTYAELKKCKLTNGEEIRLLADMLPEIKGLFPRFYLDFKSSQNPNCKALDQQKLFAQTKALVLANGMQEITIFSSDSREITQRLGGEDAIIAAVDGDSIADFDYLPQGKYLYFMAPSALYTKANFDRLSQIRNQYHQQILPIAYTVNDVKTFQKLKSLGVRHFMTDDLKLLQLERNK